MSEFANLLFMAGINLEKSLKNTDYNKNSWNAESLAQIMAVYDIYKEELTLKEVIEDLKAKIETW